MNKRPGHVVVTTQVGVCSFCGRPRNLRTEQHQLGALVRTIVTCESCHRTLSSTIGVADAEAPAPEETAAAVPAEADSKPVATKRAATPKAKASTAARAKAAATKAKAPAKTNRRTK
jgi:hypothetical protein